MSKQQPATKSNRPFDFYRDSLIRVFGYGGFIGGALRPFIPYSAVNISRAVATTYICQDIIDKASKEVKNPNRLSVAAGDATMWQLLASVIIPGIILSGVTNMRCRLMCLQSYKVKRLSHAFVNLFTIAIIMKPVDAMVDIIMDESYRKWTQEPSKTDQKGKPIKNKT